MGSYRSGEINNRHGGKMSKPKIKKGKTYEPSVLWICKTCGGFNLHPVEWNDFECIHCGVIYSILFDKEDENAN